jgi:F0F1-type ATP synthase membrane subunit c/vacuolar-type H+-ATPase subunit K
MFLQDLCKSSVVENPEIVPNQDMFVFMCGAFVAVAAAALIRDKLAFRSFSQHHNALARNSAERVQSSLHAFFCFRSAMFLFALTKALVLGRSHVP